MAEIWAVVDQAGEPVGRTMSDDRQQSIQQFLALTVGSPSERTWPECEATGFTCRRFRLVECKNEKNERPARKRA